MIIIKGGWVVDPVQDSVAEADVLINGTTIAAIQQRIDPGAGWEVLDARGLIVAPGLIDMHVHLREPGFEHKETIASGARAAVRGGITAVAAMPNTNPVADNRSVIEFVLKRAREAGWARVYPVGAITRGCNGEELAEMADMAAAGAVAFSDDGRPVRNAGVMRRAMEYARALRRPLIDHCEDPDLTADGVMNEGLVATRLGLKGTPAAAEEIMVARDILLAELTGCAVHIAHVSTEGSVRLIREAKARRVLVTAEVTPHHFSLTEEACEGFNTNAKVNPPLRTARDVKALKEGLADGTIDVIASDHAPHALDEKNVEYDRAPFGIAGLETTVGLIFKELVAPGILSLPAAIAKMTINPARILGIDSGILAPGARADITVIDPEREEVVNPEEMVGCGKNTPFAGYRLKGIPVGTIVGGRVLMWDRRLREQ
ncbi:MAG: dihydroorotase [Desulfotomaculales bacterium]